MLYNKKNPFLHFIAFWMVFRTRRILFDNKDESKM